MAYVNEPCLLNLEAAAAAATTTLCGLPLMTVFTLPGSSYTLLHLSQFAFKSLVYKYKIVAHIYISDI